MTTFMKHSPDPCCSRAMNLIHCFKILDVLGKFWDKIAWTCPIALRECHTYVQRFKNSPDTDMFYVMVKSFNVLHLYQCIEAEPYKWG